MARHRENPGEASRAIDDAALDWAVKLDQGTLSECEQARLDAWLAGDIRRVGALARAEALMAWTEPARALSPNFEPARFSASPRPGRRQFLLWGGGMAAAASLTAGVVCWPRRTTYRTAKGEVRLIPLEDGASITLNTDSHATVTSSPKGREIALLAGEAIVQVAHASNGPLRIVFGDFWIAASNAAFALSNLAEMPLSILVRQGTIALANSRDTAGIPVHADTEVTIPRHASGTMQINKVSSNRQRDAIAWLEGKIVLEGETLGEAARQFYRYSDCRIIIDDASLAKERITGLFAADDPLGFSSAIASSLGAKVRIKGQSIILSR